MEFFILLTIMCVIIVLYFNTQYKDMTYVKSDIDNKYYLVRDLKDKQHSCNFLSNMPNIVINYRCIDMEVISNRIKSFSMRVLYT